MPRPAHRRPAAVLLRCTFLTLVACVVSCGQKRAPEPSRIDPEQAALLGLTDDARDPTVRANEAGYNRWKPQPEPKGTYDPLAPERRKVGGPNPR